MAWPFAEDWDPVRHQYDTGDYLVTMSLHFDEFEEVLSELARLHNIEYLDQLLEFSRHKSDPRRRKLVVSRVLFTAVQVNDENIVRRLLSNGADPNLSNYRDNTPLHAAVLNESIPVTRLLLEHGADLRQRNVNGFSPLDVACENGSVKLVRVLTQVLLGQCREGERAKDQLLYTAMTTAAEGGRVNIIKVFTDVGVDVNLNLDPEIGTTLHVACEVGCLELVDYLISVNCDIEVLRQRIRQTPLMRACEYGHVTIVERLLQAGADINRQTDKCSSALTVACHYGQEAVVDLLLRNRADPHMRNSWGYTALFMAADSPTITSRLLEYQVDKDEICGERGEAAIHLAAVVGVRETVEILLQAGSDINLTTWYNETALWLAVWKGHADVVKLLLQLNCKLDTPSNGCRVFAWDYTPLEISLGTGEFEIAAMILRAGCSLHNSLYFEDDDEGPCLEVPWLKIRPEVIGFLDSHEEEYEKFLDILKTPKSLKDISRLKIRMVLGESETLKRNVSLLPIPSKIKELILFQDL